MKVNIFEFDNYREYLHQWLQAKRLSYRSFADKYGHIVSFIALAKLLSRGRGKMKWKADYKMSPETLARLAKSVLRLNDRELRHLLLLRLENDAEIFKGTYGMAYKNAMRQLMKENREGRQQPDFARIMPQSSRSSLLLQLFENLPQSYQSKIIEESLHQGNVYAGRQRGKVGVKKLESILTRLDNQK